MQKKFHNFVDLSSLLKQDDDDHFLLSSVLVFFAALALSVNVFVVRMMLLKFLFAVNIKCLRNNENKSLAQFTDT